MTTPRPPRVISSARARADVAEQWIEWRDHDREVEWAASALLALSALAQLVPVPSRPAGVERRHRIP